MHSTRVHARIIQDPFAYLVQGARLDAYDEKGQDLFLDIQGLQVTTSEVYKQKHVLLERVTGNYVPLRLKFLCVSRRYKDNLFTSLQNYAQDDPARIIVHFLSWRMPNKADIHYRIGLQGPMYGHLHFFARRAACERLEQPSKAISFVRDWSPAPPMPERLVPSPAHLYRQFGGDPITIKVNGQIRDRKLFVGGLDVQPDARPHVHAVLNLGEEPSRWVKGKVLHPHDRAIIRGEGEGGMTVAEMCAEAEWVIERLEQNQRVLVHCVAGMNRSTTVCCTVLMLLEGLSAEAALERVRQHHPWARPDSHHWLALRWLEMNKKGLQEYP